MDGKQERADKFTPGPWERVGSVVRTHRDTTGGFLIADCTRAELGGGQGNARLIAAAPDLYSALNGLVGMCALLLANDLPANVRQALESNHRIVEAKNALVRAEGRP